VVVTDRSQSQLKLAGRTELTDEALAGLKSRLAGCRIPRFAR
jgi:hypothetical protein